MKIPVPWAACGSRRKWSADMLKNSKWREASDNSCSSEDDEYSDPLEVCFVRIQSRGWVERDSVLQY